MLVSTGAPPAALVAAASPNPTADAGCSRDTFAIDGKNVTVRICALERERHASSLSLVTNVSVADAPGRTVTRTLAVDVLGGEARGSGDVALDGLGIAGSLHLTIEARAGRVKLEHALLVPGAVPLK